MANNDLQIEQRVENLEQKFLSFQKAFFSLFSLAKSSQNADEKVWQNIKAGYEKIQEQTFKSQYPSLYAKLKK